MIDVRLRQATTFVRVEGAVAGQRPVVFIHGAGLSSLVWMLQLGALSTCFACYAPDLPGHGRSEDVPGMGSVGDYARWLVELVETLDLGAVVWVGHGMGGAIAVECALAAPQRCLGLVLMATGPRFSAPPILFEALRSPGALWELFAEDLFFSPSTSRTFIAKSMADKIQSQRSVAVRDYKACGAWALEGEWQGLQKACLILGGRDDALVPLPLVQALPYVLSRVRLEILDDAGHMMMLEQHRRCNEMLVQFIEALGQEESAGAA